MGPEPGLSRDGGAFWRGASATPADPLGNLIYVGSSLLNIRGRRVGPQELSRAV
jgi:hypothetical protein